MTPNLYSLQVMGMHKHLAYLPCSDQIYPEIRGKTSSLEIIASEKTILCEDYKCFLNKCTSLNNNIRN